MNNMYQLRNHNEYSDRCLMADAMSECVKTAYERKLFNKVKNLVDIADKLEKSLVDMTNDSDISQAKTKIRNIDAEIHLLCKIISAKPAERKRLIKEHKKAKRKTFLKSLFKQAHNALYLKRKTISTLFFVLLAVYFVSDSIADGFFFYDATFRTNEYRYVIEAISDTFWNISDSIVIGLWIVGTWFLYNLITSIVLAIKKAKTDNESSDLIDSRDKGNSSQASEDGYAYPGKNCI